MIAISYRREDSTPVAGRLHDRLRAEFGDENVFMDFDSIPYGVDFREHIHSTLQRADVVVAVVGPGWLGGQKEASRRIDDPTDFVRLEIAGALQRGIPVIPVLVDNTPMPKSDALPPDMQAFAYRNALLLNTGIDFHHHADRLVAGIRRLLQSVPTKPTITPDEPKQTKAVGRAEAVLAHSESKDEQGPNESTSANVTPDVDQEELVPEEVPKPTPSAKEPSLASSALKPAFPLPSGEGPIKPRKSRWKREQIAIAVGGLTLVAAMCIVLFERNRSNTVATSTSPVAETTPTGSTRSAETVASNATAITSPEASPVTTVAESAAAPVATETVSANSVADSPPSMQTPSSSVRAEPVYAATPFVSSVDDTEAVRQFVRDYYGALSRRDLDSVVGMYGDDVDYQGQGHHDRRYIRNDTQNYFRRWDRIYFEAGDIDVSHTGDGDLQVKFNFPFAVGQGHASDKRGVSSQVWILRRNSQGNLQIISQREKVLAAGSETRRRRR